PQLHAGRHVDGQPAPARLLAGRAAAESARAERGCPTRVHHFGGLLHHAGPGRGHGRPDALQPDRLPHAAIRQLGPGRRAGQPAAGADSGPVLDLRPPGRGPQHPAGLKGRCMSEQTIHYGPWQRVARILVTGYAWAVLFFLILPILVIVPPSFNAAPFCSSTPRMLRLAPAAYSLRWSERIVTTADWLLAIKNSFVIGLAATVIATALGTMAAVGLASDAVPLRRLITALLLSPMIVPLIIVAAGMFFFYTRFNLVATHTGLILAHAALGVPFVILTVTATLSGFDQSLYRAGLSLGASPLRAFRDIVIPLIRPGVASGALFAFVTSFDEVVLVLFL